MIFGIRMFQSAEPSKIIGAAEVLQRPEPKFRVSIGGAVEAHLSPYGYFMAGLLESRFVFVSIGGAVEAHLSLAVGLAWLAAAEAEAFQSAEPSKLIGASRASSAACSSRPSGFNRLSRRSSSEPKTVSACARCSSAGSFNRLSRRSSSEPRHHAIGRDSDVFHEFQSAEPSKLIGALRVDMLGVTNTIAAIVFQSAEPSKLIGAPVGGRTGDFAQRHVSIGGAVEAHLSLTLSMTAAMPGRPACFNRLSRRSSSEPRRGMESGRGRPGRRTVSIGGAVEAHLSQAADGRGEGPARRFQSAEPSKLIGALECEGGECVTLSKFQSAEPSKLIGASSLIRMVDLAYR